MNQRTFKQTVYDSLPTLLMSFGVVTLIAIGLYTKASLDAPAAAAPLSSAPAHVSTYQPRNEQMVMTIVPFWVHEETGTFDYLNQDFSKKGILKDKEVWGFNPSSITVYQGDTVDITLYNPSSDPHTFTVMELGVNVPIQAEATAQVTFVASKIGTFHYMCAVGEHDPFMWGQLVVLPPIDAPQS
jgi:plastocyanin